MRDHESDEQMARGLLVFLRQNLCDSHAVAACAKRLLYTVGSLTPAEHRDLEAVLEQAWTAFYPFQGAVKLPFWLAQLYLALDQQARALEFFDHAIAMSGEDAFLLLFRSGCLERLGRFEEARAAHARAVALDPEALHPGRYLGRS